MKVVEGYYYECGLLEDFNDMVKCVFGGGKFVGFWGILDSLCVFWSMVSYCIISLFYSKVRFY